MITQNELKKLLSYDPEKGVFIWIKSRRGVKAGSQAGSFEGRYINIKIKGKNYYAHRLAWLYMKGKWPKIIDHKNEIKTDNTFKNLQSVTHSQNTQLFYDRRDKNIVEALMDCEEEFWMAA